MELETLKKNYSELQKKYDLPEFSILNRDFEIDKLDKESDYLLRVIRKLMMEKIVNSIGFLEMLLNPVNAPRLYLPYIKMMDVEDKKTLDILYGSLADLSISSLSLEIDSSEKAEAELIKKVFSEWKRLKKDFSRIINNIRKPKVLNNKRERSYFG